MHFLGLVSTVLTLKIPKRRTVTVSRFLSATRSSSTLESYPFLLVATKGSSVSDLPGFGSLELKPKLPRQNSIVKDQTTLSILPSDELDRTPNNNNSRYHLAYVTLRLER